MVARVCIFWTILVVAVVQCVRAQSCPAVVATAVASATATAAGTATVYTVSTDGWPVTNWTLALSWPRLQSAGDGVWVSGNNVSTTLVGTTATARFSLLIVTNGLGALNAAFEWTADGTTTQCGSAATTAPASGSPLVGSTLDRFRQFINTLTTVPSTGVRAVQSSGGVAGGVVSEGQAYGLMLAGGIAASLSSNDTNRGYVLDRAVELYRGWRQMCSLSASSGRALTCQDNTCGGGAYPCLPNWKFDGAITSASGTGSAADADADAMLGLVLLARSTANDSPRPVWWTELSDTAVQSCLAFLRHDTDVDGIVKLGSCWGGWSCSNPSYINLAAYRACRDYTGAAFAAQWNSVIATSTAILRGAQCPSTGLVPNWYVPNRASPATTGTTGCSGSGTPADQFGAEASRAPWRAALDWTLYRNADSVVFAQRVVLQVNAKWPSWSTLDTGCLVRSVFADWRNNAFIYAPLFSALVVPAAPLVSASQQAIVFADAARYVAATPLSSYYSGSWVALATLLMSGDMQRAACVLDAPGCANATITSTTTMASATTTTVASTTTTATTTSLRSTLSSTTTAPTTTTTTTPRTSTTTATTTRLSTLSSTSSPTPAVVNCNPLNITAAFRTRWATGYTLDLTLRNVSPTVTLGNWAVRVVIGSSTMAPPPWNAVVLSSDASSVVLGGPTWMTSLAPSASVAIGFNGNGDAAQVRVALVEYRFGGSSTWQQCAAAK